MENGGSFTGSEAAHSPPSNAEVKAKNAWILISTTPHIFLAWCLIKQGIRLHDVILT